MSTISSNRQVVINTLLESSLLDDFCAVYLFGSLLKDNLMPNDIDLLFVYTQYNYTAATKLKETKKMLESILKIDVDVVALSLNEVNETHFLEKIKNYKQIK